MVEPISPPVKSSVDAMTSLFLASFKMFGAAPFSPSPSTPAAFAPVGLSACRQVGLELVSLTTRRTQAMLDVTAKTRQCKSASDLANVTVEFWQTAWTQQIESAGRIAALFGAPMLLPFPRPIQAAKPVIARDVLDVSTTTADRDKANPVLDWNNRDRRAA